MPETAETPPRSGASDPAVVERHQLTLRGFWETLPTPGRWLLSTTAISTLGRGMTLPFTVIYMHEVRGVDLDVAGLLMGLIAVVAVLITAPVGVVTDRLGARPVVIAGLLAQVLGAVVMAFATTVPALVVAVSLLGVSFGIGWPAFNAMIASIVEGRLRTQYFGINFALVNLGIGLGGVVSGFLTDVGRPGTFTAIFLADAVCVLVPVALLLGPLRRVAGRPLPGPGGRARRRPLPDDPPPAGRAVDHRPHVPVELRRLRPDGGRVPSVRAPGQ